MPRNRLPQGNETLFPNWQKESWQTFEETSGYVRRARVNKWPQLHDRYMMMMMMMMMMDNFPKAHNNSQNACGFQNSVSLSIYHKIM